MKRISILLITLLFLKMSYATTHEVQVANFQFTPKNLNVIVGDTIKWVWVDGGHTTTSLTIPNGSASWDAPINSVNTTFIYKVTVEGTYNYECTIHAPTMAGTITATGSLPVILNSFSIMPGGINSALLSWSTATEQNTDHYEIMRSTDGNNFDNIGIVAAKGNSSALSNYTFSDDAIPASYKYLYYYLSIIDKDDKKTISDIELFRNANGTPKLIVQLSPNPISRPGHLMLQFNSDKDNTMLVQLYNMAGKLVKQADMSAVAGLNNGHFHIGDVTAGAYTIVFTMDDKKESYKIVVR